MAQHRYLNVRDQAWYLSDGGTAWAADAYAEVSAADVTIDLGGTEYIEGDVEIEITAMEVASGDESYKFSVALSNSATFASGVVLANAIEVGDEAAANINQNTADTPTTSAKYVIPFRNEWAGTHYRYLRLHVSVTGTVATGISYIAWASKRGN